MIDKPDPAKDAGRPDTSGGKRPHATLDLKATEVKPPQAAVDSRASTSAADASASASSSSTSDAKPSSATSSSPSSAPSPAAANTASKPAGSSETSTPKTAAATAAGPAKPASPPKPEAAPARPSSGGGLFSHLAAGIVGGALVYAGASYLGPNWLPGSGAPSDTQARLTALEKDNAEVTSLKARLADAEGRVAKLDEVERNLAGLRDTQSALEAQTKEAAQKSDATQNTERLTKLEEQLSMIAAGSAASDGRVPQLAAITGKISDVEQSLNAQIADLRRALPSDVDQRISSSQETSEAAKSATTRIDRELSQLRTEQARGAQKIEGAKAEVERLSTAVQAVREETARVTSTIGEMKSAVDSQLKSFAKPADVSAAVTPLTSKIAEVEQNVQSVMQSEQTRKQNAERIVLSLELSNLKRAIDRGQGSSYAAELDEVRKASGGQLDLAALDRFKGTGVATTAQLKAEFRPLINAVLDADTEPADGSVIDRLLAGAKSVVRVRKISHDAEDNSTEAIVSRMEAALDDGRLGDVIAQAKTLPQRARVPLEDWLAKVSARDAVDQSIAAVDSRLKASLSGASEPAPPAAPPAPPAKN